ncbi:MAG: hypothetical protein JSS35_14540 [Proteobacteria bacterium]|nr:hypothetical protein [Pseudomonadota bacterium]
MPFSIGNHITFDLPLAPGGELSAVTFATSARSQIVTAGDQALPTGEIQPASFAAPQPVASLKPRQSVALGDFPGTPSVTIDDPAGLQVTVSHVETARPAGTPVLFNLWADPKLGFFSPEPWVGKVNALVTGDGLVELPPGQEFVWAISVRVTATSRRGP